MNSLHIHLENDRTQHAPGDTIKGTAEWNILHGDPGDAHVHLLWHTEGKGTKDVGLVHSVTAQSSGGSGKCDFEWTIPESPYSYNGTLLSIVWEVEVVVDDIAEVGKVQIEVHPSHKEIDSRKVKSQTGWVPSGF